VHAGADLIDFSDNIITEHERWPLTRGLWIEVAPD
jgi:hypothetical protein